MFTIYTQTDESFSEAVEIGEEIARQLGETLWMIDTGAQIVSV